jgi:hypothetical protein
MASFHPMALHEAQSLHPNFHRLSVTELSVLSSRRSRYHPIFLAVIASLTRCFQGETFYINVINSLHNSTYLQSTSIVSTTLLHTTLSSPLTKYCSTGTASFSMTQRGRMACVFTPSHFFLGLTLEYCPGRLRFPMPYHARQFLPVQVLHHEPSRDVLVPFASV